MKKKKPSPIPKKRNLVAKQSANQKSGPMKDRREARRGARNTFTEDLQKLD